MTIISQALREKAHGFRLQIVEREIEEVRGWEQVTEEIEEREFDQQEHLRVHRTIRRDIARGSAARRLRLVEASLKAGGASEENTKATMRDAIDQALNETSRELTPHHLAEYAEIAPRNSWPAILAYGKNGAKIRQELESRGLEIETGRLDQLGILKFKCPPEDSALNAISQIDGVEALEDPEIKLRHVGPSAAADAVCDHRRMLHFPMAGPAIKGEGVTLAVLDTGIDVQHPAFEKMSRDDYRDFTGTGEEDVDGHGTHVASLAAGEDRLFDGRLSGIAPGVRLVVGKVIPHGGLTPLEVVLEAMAWAIFEKRADVLSMSVGDEKTPNNGCSLWSRACGEAVRHGTVVCAAAGNFESPYPGCITVPGDSRLVVTVGALNPQGYLAAFSALGHPEPEAPLYGKPDTVAPGVNIAGARSRYSAFADMPETNGLYTILSGTSMATPIVAGCLALLKAKAIASGWSIGPRELLDIYYASCRQFKDEKGQSYSAGVEIGHGLIKMDEALALVELKSPTRANHARETQPRAEAAPPSKPVKEVPTMTNAPSPSAQREDLVCVRCGRTSTRTGFFAPSRTCPGCGGLICSLCGGQGYTACMRHEATVIEPKSAHGTEQPSSAGAPAGTRIDMAEAFLNAFDLNVKRLKTFHRPESTALATVEEKAQHKEFVREFGKVRQYEGKAGFRHTVDINLTAITLNYIAAAALFSGSNLFNEILERRGLDIKVNIFYVIGVFSGEGWPETYRTMDLSRANARFVLVEKGNRPWWDLYPENSEYTELFDPESAANKKTRGLRGIQEHPELRISSNSVRMDKLSESLRVPVKLLKEVVGESKGKYRVMEHRGVESVIRTSGV